MDLFFSVLFACVVIALCVALCLLAARKPPAAPQTSRPPKKKDWREIWRLRLAEMERDLAGPRIAQDTAPPEPPRDPPPAA